MENEFILEEDATEIFTSPYEMEPNDVEEGDEDDEEGLVREDEEGEEGDDREEGEEGEEPKTRILNDALEVDEMSEEFLRKMLTELDSCEPLSRKCAKKERDCPQPPPVLRPLIESANIPSTKNFSPVFVTGDARRTSAVMTRFERTRIIGLRAREIEADGAENLDPKIIAKITELGLTSALDIAEVELEDASVPHPFTIFRPLTDSTFEVWRVRDLILRSQLVNHSYSDEASRLLSAWKETVPDAIQKYGGSLKDF